MTGMGCRSNGGFGGPRRIFTALWRGAKFSGLRRLLINTWLVVGDFAGQAPSSKILSLGFSRQALQVV